MDTKQHPHHFWRDLTAVIPGILVLVAIAFGIIAVVALRSNNLKMVELRQNVYAADQSGKGVEEALKTLREHVYNHMNTELVSGPNAVRPPIQLKYTYDRLVQAEQIKQEAAKNAASSANATIYSDAQKYCEKKIPDGFSGRYRLDCIQQYVTAHPANTQAVVGPDTIDIPKSLYQFDFVSPRWSPDLAGWSLLAMVVSLLAAALIWATHIIRRLIHKGDPHVEEDEVGGIKPTHPADNDAHPKVVKKAATQHPIAAKRPVSKPASAAAHKK